MAFSSRRSSSGGRRPRVFSPLPGLLLLCLLGSGCDSGDGAPETLDVSVTVMQDGDVDARLADGGPMEATISAAIDQLPADEEIRLPGLGRPVRVLFTELGVPHLYAHDKMDLGLALGYLVARDRFFIMDMERRLGKGTLSALVGDVTLETDLSSRLTGMPIVARRLLENLSPEMSSYLQKFADGVNAYIDDVAQGLAPPPSELSAGAGLFGALSPDELMERFTVEDIAAMGAVFVYQTTFDASDVSRTASLLNQANVFDGLPHEGLRRASFLEDVTRNMTPLRSTFTLPGLGLNGQIPRSTTTRSGDDEGERSASTINGALVLNSAKALERFSHTIKTNQREGRGSNTWAVSGRISADGATLVAGDGHLPIAIPAITYQVGLNTSVFGDGPIHQLGLLFASLPLMAAGTNGQVAWSGVNPYADTTDWYAESVVLGADGVPSATILGDETRPITQVLEEYEVAEVFLLNSVGRTERLARFETFDGRLITDIEGHEVDWEPGDEPRVQGPVLQVLGRRVVPADVDADGVISAVSLDSTGFDTAAFLDTVDRMSMADSAESFRQAMRGVIGTGLYFCGGDMAGDIFFSSYQAIPCRQYLERSADGRWLEGANPRFLLDGTRYRGFTIRHNNGVAVEGAADPYECVIPFEVMPQAINPEPGFVVAANNDPSGLTEDGRLDTNDWYIGGPWTSARAAAIVDGLRAGLDEDRLDLSWMSRVQGLRASILGASFVPHLLEALDEAASAEPGEPFHQRYDAKEAQLDEMTARLRAWQLDGYDTPSGVETFYHQPSQLDRDNAVATMIFNVWLRQFIAYVWADEGLENHWTLPREQFQVLSLLRFLNNAETGGFGAHPETGDSIFFDRVETEPVEDSTEAMFASAVSALEYLESPSTGPSQGGFGTSDMSTWLWGLRHQARFASLLASFLPPGSTFSEFLNRFSITTAVLPLTDDLDTDDPRAELTWFPRGGDMWAPDAAHPGLSGDDFTHGNGPVMRMVMALKDGQVQGRNIIPGGQSALTDSAHFADQAALWLANETVPMRYSTRSVIEGTEQKLLFTPAALE